jgi:integrase
MLPVAQWPEADRTAWLVAKTSNGRLHKPGRAARLSPATWKMMEDAHGCYLGWLSGIGELDAHAPPGSCVTFQYLANFLVQLRSTCSANTIFNRLRMHAMLLACIAPGHSWTWICHHPQAPKREEARASRRAPRVFAPGELLHHLHVEMEHLINGNVNRSAAVRFRDALLVATAAYTNLRRRNLREMRIGRNLLQDRSSWRLTFEANETKTHRPISMRWPQPLDAHLVTYLNTIRPKIVRHDVPSLHSPVFPTPRGTILAEPSIECAFRRAAMRASGQPLNPHSVRHTSATVMLTHDPASLELAAAALGHSSQKTVARFYDHSASDIAQLEWFRIRELTLRSNRGERT